MSKNVIKAAGCIVFRDISGHLQVLLVGGSRSEPDYWGFPKGHKKSREPIEATAVREVHEETGMRVEILALVGVSEYPVRRKNKLRDKQVRYYLARAYKGSIADKDDELQYVVWLSLDQAAQTVTYDADRALLSRARTLVDAWYRDML